MRVRKACVLASLETATRTDLPKWVSFDLQPGDSAWNPKGEDITETPLGSVVYHQFPSGVIVTHLPKPLVLDYEAAHGHRKKRGKS